ncbi:P8 family protein [Loigolactobacillus iwatensis]|uniref:P8 family protein n=1 Tax=Loigolactobacillus iwatensis TaxID=1267156 RepID=UPI000F7DE79B|nr:hypothetical protein [Loigolactobacillus iwatensis]
MAEEVTEPKILDKKMNEAFDWSKDTIPVRDAVWNYFMENNNHDTEKSLTEMKPYVDGQDDAKVKDFVEKNLKK